MSAIKTLILWLKEHKQSYSVQAIGHRIVQGGTKHIEPETISPILLSYLETMVILAPEHLPTELEAIRHLQEAFPETIQVACFDTAFHRTMPFEAQHYALPRSLWKEGLIRYGFHGLSYEYILHQLKETIPEAEKQKVIIAHLGNGCSMVAIKEGQSVDTTMGLTPAGGMIMSTRAGDIDPGVVLYLLQKNKMTTDELNQLFNERAGLKAISESSMDVQQLLQKESSDPQAAEAIGLFCYSAKKFIGALTAVINGLNILIFTGGIGEHSGTIRERICRDMDFLGIQLDNTKNKTDSQIISHENSRVKVLVIPTNEEKMIAIHTRAMRTKNSD